MTSFKTFPVKLLAVLCATAIAGSACATGGSAGTQKGAHPSAESGKSADAQTRPDNELIFEGASMTCP